MALYVGLVNDDDKTAVLNNLITDIKSSNNALTAGDIGYRYVLKVLANAGRSDIIFDMNNRSDVPGYGYQLTHGATALTESWQALPNVSNNHFMLGHIMEWFYESLAGIAQNDSSVAFKNIVINPQIVGDITHAEASFQSPYGLIKSGWKKENGTLQLNVTIPANTTATVYLPANESSIIQQNNKTIKANIINAKAVITIGSGKYLFNVK